MPTPRVNFETTTKKTARRRSLYSSILFRSGRDCCALAATAVGHQANASEAKDHHRPSGWFGDGGNGGHRTDAASDHTVYNQICAVYFPSAGVIDIFLKY